MTGTVYRLLGPSHNRLVTVTEDPERRLGQIDETTSQLLQRHGWTRYAGTAKTRAGWVVPGTDPDLRPRKVQVS
jgi:hypothetical protein